MTQRMGYLQLCVQLLIGVTVLSSVPASASAPVCTTRYYLSGIAGEGTFENPFHPAIADFPNPHHSFVESYGALSSNQPWTLVLVASRRHDVLSRLPQFGALPDLPFDTPLALICASELAELAETLAQFGIDTAIPDTASTYGEVIRYIGQLIEPAFELGGIFVSC